MAFHRIAIVAALALAAMPLAHATTASTSRAGDDHAQAAADTGTAASASANPTGAANGSVPGHEATAKQKAELKAAKKGTGAARVHAEKQEHMPVPKTGM